MENKIWIIIVIAMCLLLAVSSMFIVDDFASWLSNCAISIGIIYLIIQNRNKAQNIFENSILPTEKPHRKGGFSCVFPLAFLTNPRGE